MIVESTLLLKSQDSDSQESLINFTPFYEESED
jgi:hypothetical protein